MAWLIEFEPHVEKELSDLDRTVQRRVLSFLEERLATADNPRLLGKALVGNRYGACWRYRVGDYRIICDIQDATITILVIKIGNRREVYR